MDRKSLDDILDGNDEPETTEAVEQPEPETQGVEPEPEGEPEGQPEAGPPPADKLPQDVYEPLKAVRSENKELKDQLEALRREIQQQQEQKPAEPAPDIWENTEGWQSHFGGQVVNQAVQAASYQNKLSTSEFYARKNIEGFEQSWSELNEWLTANPAIAQQAAADYDPWGFAYRQFDNAKRIKELGATDVSQLEQQLREKIMAEMQANVPTQPTVPPSLSSKRNVGNRSGPAWTGPKSLDELLD